MSNMFAKPVNNTDSFKLTETANIGKLFAISHTGDRMVDTKFGEADVAVSTVWEIDLAAGVTTEHEGVFIFPAYIRNSVRDATGKPVLGTLRKSEEHGGDYGTAAWILEPVDDATSNRAAALLQAA